MHYFNKLDSIYVPSSFVLHVPQDNPKAEAAASLQRVKDMMSSADFVFGPEWVEKYHDDLIKNQIGSDVPIEYHSDNAKALLKFLHDNKRLRLTPAAKKAYHEIHARLKDFFPRTETPTTPFPILYDTKRSLHIKSSETGTLRVEMLPRYSRYQLRLLPDPLAGTPLRLKAVLGLLTPGFCEYSISNEEAERIVKEELKRQKKSPHTLDR